MVVAPPTKTSLVTPIPSAVRIPDTVKSPVTEEGPTMIGPLFLNLLVILSALSNDIKL